jgi:hypothetical protein
MDHQKNHDRLQSIDNMVEEYVVQASFSLRWVAWLWGKILDDGTQEPSSDIVIPTASLGVMHRRDIS